MTRMISARVFSAHGRSVWVHSDREEPMVCQLSGRALSPIANDQVLLDFSVQPPVIREVQPRTNVFRRQEGSRTKILAANIDLALVLVSGHPGFSPELAVRVVASLLAESIPFVIVKNKWDLESARPLTEALLRQVQPCMSLPAWPTVMTSCKRDDGLDGLKSLLTQLGRPGLCVALAGQSGMGKSSLLNRLAPHAHAQTQTISEALQTGKHTTTVSRAYSWIQPSGQPGFLIDTPGFQQFGLSHLSRSEHALAFPEWAHLNRGQPCRFHNCRHDQEPGCSVLSAISRAQEAGDRELQVTLEARRKLWLALEAGS
ncbi:MAG: ribosome small subunit-dependent GTPase A [Betaproteobacteria bacterium]|nr:ribosome small subunit-dependent GTPase A [Betaproteobacteria bacterium]